MLAHDCARRLHHAFFTCFFAIAIFACVLWFASPALSLSSADSTQKNHEPLAEVHPSQLKSAMFTWRIGVNDPHGAIRMVETIFPATHQGKDVWRVVHRADDPSDMKFEFDMYDVDRATLEPVRAVYKADQFFRSLSFQDGKVKIENLLEGKTSNSEISLSAKVMPAEGPGSNLFFASLPLKVGYVASFYVVDRWAADEKQSVHLMKCSVTGKETIKTQAGQFEVFVVVEEPVEGGNASRSKHWVLATAPHYSLRTEYTPRPGETKVSEVTSLLVSQ